MGINFPSSPTNGQKLTSGRTVWTFSNGAWRSSADTAEARNLLINPAMQIKQPAASSGYIVDQWFQGTSIAGVTWGRFAGPTPNGSIYVIALGIPTPKPTLAATDYVGFGQPLEGFRIRDLQWGTPAAKQVVLRFYFWPSVVGTYSISVNNPGSPATRSYINTFTVTQVASGQYYTFVIPGDTTGTWGWDNGLGLYVYVSIAVGSTYVTATKGWQAGDKYAHTSSTNNAAAANSCWLGDVGFHADPLKTGLPPPWECVSDRQAMYDSLRYWHMQRYGQGISVNHTGGPQRMGQTNMAVMRTDPSASFLNTPIQATDISLGATFTSIANSYYNQWGDEANYTTDVIQSLGHADIIYTGTFAVDARL
jgi:hypothetical protein